MGKVLTLACTALVLTSFSAAYAYGGDQQSNPFASSFGSSNALLPGGRSSIQRTPPPPDNGNRDGFAELVTLNMLLQALSDQDRDEAIRYIDRRLQALEFDSSGYDRDEEIRRLNRKIRDLEFEIRHK